MTPEELMGRVSDVPKQRQMEAGTQALFHQLKLKRKALEHDAFRMAHFFSFIHDLAFARINLQAFATVIDDFDTAEQALFFEVHGGATTEFKQALSARQVHEVAAEVLGTKDTSLSAAKHALLLKLANKEYVRTTLVFLDRANEERGSAEDERMPMDPMLHEQIHKNLGLVAQLAGPDVGVIDGGDLRAIIQQELGYELTTKPPQIREAETLATQVQANIVHPDDARDFNEEGLGIPTKKRPPPPPPEGGPARKKTKR